MPALRFLYGRETRINQEEMGVNKKQEKALALILQGEKDGEVGKRVRVSRETVNRWKNHDEEFRAALLARQAELWNEHRIELRCIYQRAIEILMEALNSPNENVRIRAALAVAKFPAIQAYLKPEKEAENEEEFDMLEVLGLALNKLEAEGRGVQPKKDEEVKGFLTPPWKP